jgi:hypothetical protein
MRRADMDMGFAAPSFRLPLGLSWWKLGSARFRFCRAPRVELKVPGHGPSSLRVNMPSPYGPHSRMILEEGGAAIDIDGLAGNGAGLVGAEEERGAGDLVGGLAATLQNRI